MTHNKHSINVKWLCAEEIEEGRKWDWGDTNSNINGTRKKEQIGAKSLHMRIGFSILLVFFQSLSSFDQMMGLTASLEVREWWGKTYRKFGCLNNYEVGSKWRFTCFLRCEKLGQRHIFFVTRKTSEERVTEDVGEMENTRGKRGAQNMYEFYNQEIYENGNNTV